MERYFVEERAEARAEERAKTRAEAIQKLLKKGMDKDFIMSLDYAPEEIEEAEKQMLLTV